jgi:hypothetical protein
MVINNEIKRNKHNKSLFNNALRLYNFHFISIFNILVNVFKKNEYSIKSNYSDVKYDTI